MSEWQPIETAPKDGTHVLLFYSQFADRKVHLSYFVDKEEFAYGASKRKYRHWHTEWFWSDRDRPEPSHWMPIPEPPVKS